MRGKLLKLLRELELESGKKNGYFEYVEYFDSEYWVEEYLDFPNYGLVANLYDEKYPVYLDDGDTLVSSKHAVKAELKRMEADGLVMIGTQKGFKNMNASHRHAPDHESVKFETECLVLTTKGKSVWRYFLHKATDNPVATGLSLIAIIISIISLFI